MLGVLPRDAGIEAPSRHLGLVPAAERDDGRRASRRLADQIAEHVDLTRPRASPTRARPLDAEPGTPRPSRCDRSSERAAGGRRRRRSRVHLPLRRDRRAAARRRLRAGDLRPADRPGAAARHRRALPRAAASPRCTPPSSRPTPRCGPTLAGRDRRRAARPSPSAPGCSTSAGRSTARPMVGAIAADATMTPRLTLRYRTAVADHDHLLAAAGEPGHRARVPPHRGRAASADSAAWLVDGEPAGFSADPAGSVAPPCTPATCTCTGPATRTWRSGSPTPCTPSRSNAQWSARHPRCTKHRRHQVPQRRTRWTALADASRTSTTTATETSAKVWSTSRSTYGCRDHRTG